MAKRKIAYNIEWADQAKQQFFDILEYWNLRNKSTSYSEKLIDIVDERLKYLSQYPKSSTKTNIPESRICVLGHYSIIYKVQKTQIYIMAFWDNRQDPRKLRELLKE
ncbi:MAG: plasmid stabilization protein [Flavobacteriales bacterium]|nr:plasmid stabilization protein [Flavobacteriales bacterium]|tara:strand:- start:2071 stop:2391 length:321 start_codon:yes stop_codon:yes gene_type:complete